MTKHCHSVFIGKKSRLNYLLNYTELSGYIEKKVPSKLWLIPKPGSQPIPSVPSLHNGQDLPHIPFNSLVSLFLETFPDHVSVMVTASVVVKITVSSGSPITVAFSRLSFTLTHQRDPVA